MLEEAEQSFRTSIELEGKPCEGGVMPAKLSEQQWFKDREAKQEAEKKAKETGTPQKAQGTPGKVAQTGAKTGTTATRGRGGKNLLQ